MESLRILNKFSKTYLELCPARFWKFLARLLEEYLFSSITILGISCQVSGKFEYFQGYHFQIINVSYDLLKIIEKEERNGCHPRKLGAAICKIVARKNPPFRTKVGPLVQVLFAKSKSWLPDSVMQYALRIFYAIR